MRPDARILSVLDALLNNRDISVDDAVEQHFSDDYRQRTDGVWSDRAGFVEHIAHLREIIDRAEIEVLDELVYDRSYADRHRAHITRIDGTIVVQEVYLFGALADDGRFTEVHEATHMITGTDADRDIGNARADHKPARHVSKGVGAAFDLGPPLR
ncbi:hypothetical protein [Microbacterium sp. SORGH_AS_0888]|uniref:hypothetical protein n=1 Tax=Microbacterium sp. SORGH_AS_0888 TaxID=3041791 RepID=UPI00277E19FE|nr:hypothetical protein [Microbacterium sp. SORGH_AS_0888]MDQ1130881.1 hypothetical protein [Microbacterium sp. SORGH_AS_0888]